MKILHLASEFSPIAKTGGLADVVSGLSKEQNKAGHSSCVILPKYDSIPLDLIENLHICCENLMTYWSGTRFANHVWSGEFQGVKLYLIDPLPPLSFFSRGTLYGCEDDIERFLYFSRAACEFIFQTELKPDIVHLHDWQTAVGSALIKEIFAANGPSPKIIQTIHNMAYQGQCSPLQLEHSGLNPIIMGQEDKMLDPHWCGQINLLKGGIVYADALTTVSSAYVHEIQAPAGGRGLEQLIQKHIHKFSGILNGLDFEYWNPESDPLLITPYQTSNAGSKKKKNRKHLYKKLGMEYQDVPLVASIGRLVEQKGLDLIEHAIHYSLEKGGHFVLLGVAPDPQIHARFEAIQQQFAHHPGVHLELKQSEELIHLIFASSDILVVPSVFEPCGLTQLIGLRYGTVPVVRKTGGLGETVQDIGTSKLPLDQRNGFVFEHYDREGLQWALGRAIDLYFQSPKAWKALRRRGMEQDFSWKLPQKRYSNLYKQQMTPSEPITNLQLN